MFYRALGVPLRIAHTSALLATTALAPHCILRLIVAMETAILIIPQIRRENSGYKSVSDWLNGNKVYRFTDISKGSQTIVGGLLNFIGSPVKIPVDR